LFEALGALAGQAANRPRPSGLSEVFDRLNGQIVTALFEFTMGCAGGHKVASWAAASPAAWGWRWAWMLFDQAAGFEFAEVSADAG
jgi:hypothetical protein